MKAAFFFLLIIALTGRYPLYGQEQIITAPPVPGPVISAAPSLSTSPCSTIPCERIYHPPAFKMIFHNISGQIHILVSRKTTVKQLENLIYYIAEERKLNEFEKIGLPSNRLGEYPRGSILVFNEKKWAEGERLTNPRIKERTYSKKVIAEYIWNSHSETAYIGQKTLFSHALQR